MAWQLYAPSQVNTMTMLNVKDYGAVGNGSTNDAAAIQAAINAAGALGVSGRGVDVYFPAGVYAIGSTITVNFSNVMLRGAGWQSTILYATFTTTDILQFGNGASKSGSGLMNMSVWCSAARTTGASINVNAMNDCLIQNFVINNCFQGILVQGTSIKVWIDQGEINNIGVTTGVGIQVTNGLAGDTYIQGIVMSNSPAAKPAAGIQITQTGHLSILRCNITSCIKGLHCNPAAAATDVTYLFIEHSLFDSCGTHGAHFNATVNAGARIRSVMAVNSWFSGTTTTGATSSGIEFTATTGIVDGASFVACRILNNQRHGVLINAAATNISFTDCTITGNGAETVNTYDGINIAANVNGIAAINCKIGQAGTAGNQQKYAINVAAGTSANLMFCNNDCQPNGTVGNRGYINVGAITGGGNIIEGNTPGVSKGFGSARVGATGSITVTDTLVSDVTAQRNRLLANSLCIGSSIRVTIEGTYQVSTGAGTWNCFIRMGTGNVVGDAAVLSLGAQTTGATVTGPNAFKIVATLTIRSLTTCFGYFEILENTVPTATFGLIANKQLSYIQGIAAAITATQANYVNASMIGSANCALIVQSCTIEVVTP